MNNIMTVQQMHIFNIGIDLFCILELLIILRYLRRHTSASQEYILFRYIITFTILALLGDGMCWLVNGMTAAWIPVLNYLSNFLYMTSQMLGCMFTFVFFYWIRYGREPDQKAKIFGFIIPFIVVMLVTYTTPWTGLVFTIDAGNFYQRGILLPFLSMLTLTYIVAGSFLCAVHIKQVTLQDQKRRLQILACYCIPVIMGSLIQTTFYGISLVLPCSAAALLMIFINEQDLKISVDSLTGLNNRGCFDRYLNEQLEGTTLNDIGLIMIDVNDFKKINDEFGHIQGDSALQMISDILRRAVGNQNIFLARYGGDEFACILHTSQVSINKVVKGISAEVDLCNQAHPQMPKLSLAVGWSMYQKNTVCTASQLIHDADAMMYEKKRIMKQQNNTSTDHKQENSFLNWNRKK